MRNITRRRFLSCAAGLTAASWTLENSQVLRAIPASESLLGKVRIRDVETASIQLNYPAHLVKITTSAGPFGIGEAFIGPGVVDCIRHLKSFVIGEDPLQVDFLWTKMTEAVGGYGALTGTMISSIAGIESALWDLAGKILQVPIYVLLGGKFRDKLLVYHDTGSPNTVDPKAWVEEALRSREYGFRAMKFDLDWETTSQGIQGKVPYRYRRETWNRTLTSTEISQWVKILEEIRSALGPGIDVGVDLHWILSTRDGLRLAQALEPLKLWFLEDPTPPENAEAMARITAGTKTPICTGENLYTRQGFRPYIEKQACDIIQPDPQKCGGLLETKKIADFADLYYITMACHNMCTPVGTYGSAQACAAIRSFAALESDSIEIPWWKDLIVNDGGKAYKDGYLTLPTSPGIGVELNEEVCRQHLVAGTQWFRS